MPAERFGKIKSRVFSRMLSKDGTEIGSVAKVPDQVALNTVGIRMLGPNQRRMLEYTDNGDEVLMVQDLSHSPGLIMVVEQLVEGLGLFVESVSWEPSRPFADTILPRAWESKELLPTSLSFPDGYPNIFAEFLDKLKIRVVVFGRRLGCGGSHGRS